MKLRVLCACEFSGTVRDAFLRRGHDAMSCDLLPTSAPGPHYQGNVLDVLNDGWNLMVGHPPCTYLCSSGMHWTTRGLRDPELTEEALAFVRALLDAPIEKIAIENPVGCISTQIRESDQIIQPWMFGHDASKSTCLWLKNLPLLVATEIIPPAGYRNAEPNDIGSAFACPVCIPEWVSICGYKGSDPQKADMEQSDLEWAEQAWALG